MAWGGVLPLGHPRVSHRDLGTRRMGTVRSAIKTDTHETTETKRARKRSKGDGGRTASSAYGDGRHSQREPPAASIAGGLVVSTGTREAQGLLGLQTAIPLPGSSGFIGRPSERVPIGKPRTASSP